MTIQLTYPYWGGIAQHIKTNVQFVIKAQHMADVLIAILGTKLDIGTSQIRTLVVVAAISQNGRQLLVKTSYTIGATCNNN